MTTDPCGVVASWGSVCTSAPGHPGEHDWRHAPAWDVRYLLRLVADQRDEIARLKAALTGAILGGTPPRLRKIEEEDIGGVNQEEWIALRAALGEEGR